MRTLISFAALFLSVAFVQLGSGSLGPLDALAGASHGFTTREIGLLGSSHYVGFFVGCWATPRLMAGIGHTRAFAAVAAVGAIGALLHPILVDPLVWALLRLGTGFAVAGAYTVIESWLQSQIENANRGRVLGVYQTVDMTASVAAQGVIAVVDPASYVAYNLIATVCCLCLLPITVTRRQAPAPPVAPRLRPLKAALLSPLGVAGAVAVGLTNSAFRMVGPVYAAENGLKGAEISLFLALGLVGGALSQIPVGRLADRFDRRIVLVGLSLAALGVSAATLSGVVSAYPGGIHLTAFLFGAAAFPLYSTSAAHANDRADVGFIVELNATLLFMFAAGAVVSPVLSAALIASYGPGAMFAYIGAVHVFLIVFGLYRMAVAEEPETRRAYRYMPRTSLNLSRLLGRRRALTQGEEVTPERPPTPGDAGTEAPRRDTPEQP